MSLQLDRLLLVEKDLLLQMKNFDIVSRIPDKQFDIWLESHSNRIIICGSYYSPGDLLKKAYPEKYAEHKKQYAENIDKMTFEDYKNLAIELNNIQTTISTIEKYSI